MAYTRGEFVAKALTAGAGAVAFGAAVGPSLAAPSGNATSGRTVSQSAGLAGGALRGRIVAVQSDGAVTIVDKHGRWHRARTSASTRIWKHAKPERNALKTGDQLIAHGSVGADGVFEIQRVWVAETAWKGALSFFPDPPHAYAALAVEA